jgi:hypothetical protein
LDNNFHPDFSTTGKNILQHLFSLIISDFVVEEFHTKLTITSTILPSFSLTLYLREQTAPQEANDVSVYYYGNKDVLVPVMTLLGYKNRSKRIKIDFVDEDIEVLHTGLFGFLYGAGEHLEKDEQLMIQKLRVDKADALKRGEPIEMPETDRSTTRAIVEELGVVVNNSQHVKRYLIGIHDRDGRDPRYWEHLFKGRVYGYKRYSMAVMIAVLININNFPAVIGDPADCVECGKAKLIRLQQLVNGFKSNGQFKPAIPAHEEQLQIVVKTLPKLLSLAQAQKV